MSNEFDSHAKLLEVHEPKPVHYLIVTYRLNRDETEYKGLFDHLKTLFCSERIGASSVAVRSEKSAREFYDEISKYFGPDDVVCVFTATNGWVARGDAGPWLVGMFA